MSSSTGIDVILTHGSDRHKVLVVAQEPNDEPTLQDLALAAEKITGVAIGSQKLIYKGKSLKEMEEKMLTVGIKNGCKIMLIGKKCSPEEDAELKKLKDFEKSVEQLEGKLEEVKKELSGIQKGFLSKNLQAEALGKLDKRVKTSMEQFMNILEQVDSLNVPENFSDLRQKRKGLVKRIQILLAMCDTAEGNIGQEMDKLRCQNLALSK
ncbi:BAG family molecular chaperone regulator 1 [Bombina bombina]|uniref:BAG family molecular chaperone regulator 1 n=1 Tax=Bombina bombina TaxID=8345 RepID=UPI00235A6EAA|nr:BAG family molecular chaperone regulator 1 [Bombina bombina]